MDRALDWTLDWAETIDECVSDGTDGTDVISGYRPAAGALAQLEANRYRYAAGSLTANHCLAPVH
jgi:hypothetical protein